MTKTQTKVVKNIRKLLTQRGISAEKLAFEIDMSKSYLYAFMAGKKGITLESLERIAEGLDIDIKNFFE
ncbi:helix-turn-helix domain-containing protein [bacterium]|nr:helix-turn-helix domain-containing protein [bacterium]